MYMENISVPLLILHSCMGLKALRTWIGEEPGGDVCPCAHNVLNIQTGFHTGLSVTLSAHDPFHLGVMRKAPAKEGHELSQVCRAVVLLQELKEKRWLETVYGLNMFIKTTLRGGAT